MIERHTLPNGLRVVVEDVPGVRSVACGVFVDVGSRDEADVTHGASHFLEHLLFKGTERWSAAGLARALDCVGGEFNAYTSKEQTVFYVRVLDDDLPLGLDILADITRRPALREADVESERSVVLEEIGMYEDSPDELVFDVFAEAMLPDHSLGRPVIGTRDTIAAMPRDAIAGWFGERYRPDRMVIAAAGHLDPGAFVEQVAALWGDADGAAPPRAFGAVTAPAPRRIVGHDSEQVHLLIGMPTFAATDPRRHALGLVNHVLGGGMSSRLFQEVREKRGLVYSVYSFRQAFADCGHAAVYAGSAPERAEETLATIGAELDALGAGLTSDEIRDAKRHLRGALALSEEDTMSRMFRIGRAELILGEVPGFDEIIARVEAVTDADANALAELVASAPRTLAVLGPVDAAFGSGMTGAATAPEVTPAVTPEVTAPEGTNAS